MNQGINANSILMYFGNPYIRVTNKHAHCYNKEFLTCNECSDVSPNYVNHVPLDACFLLFTKV